MNIRFVTKMDIPKWRKLSNEHDKYVLEIVSDLTEWYEGNGTDISQSFDFYMESKIKQNEAFISIDENDNCIGIVAFSYKRNYITFFGVSDNSIIKVIGNELLIHVLSLMDKEKPIFVNEINSKSDKIMQYVGLYIENGFKKNGNAIENGVPVDVYIKNP